MLKAIVDFIVPGSPARSTTIPAGIPPPNFSSKPWMNVRIRSSCPIGVHSHPADALYLFRGGYQERKRRTVPSLRKIRGSKWQMTCASRRSGDKTFLELGLLAGFPLEGAVKRLFVIRSVTTSAGLSVLFVPERNLKDLVIRYVRDQERSISALTKQLETDGYSFHRLFVTGYLKALADVGMLGEKEIPPAKVYMASAHREPNLYEMVGERGRG